MKTKFAFWRISFCMSRRASVLCFVLFILSAIAAGGFPHCAVAATDNQKLKMDILKDDQLTGLLGKNNQSQRPEAEILLEIKSFSIQKNSLEEGADLDSENVTPWRYNFFTLRDRNALLKFMMQFNEFKLHSSGAKLSSDICGGLPSKIISSQMEILEPAETQATINAKATQTKCQNLHSLRLFAPVTGSPFDLLSSYAFSELSEQEKIAKADTFYKPTANFEYYDFSNILGKNIWGFLGEGLVHVYNPRYPKWRKEFSNYQHRTSFGGIGAVYDLHTCEADYYPQPLFAQRGIPDGQGEISAELPSFSGYILIDKKLYLLVVQSTTPWKELDRLMNGGAAVYLFLTEVLSPKKELEQYKRVSANTNERTCIYKAE